MTSEMPRSDSHGQEAAPNSSTASLATSMSIPMLFIINSVIWSVAIGLVLRACVG